VTTDQTDPTQTYPCCKHCPDDAGCNGEPHLEPCPTPDADSHEIDSVVDEEPENPLLTPAEHAVIDRLGQTWGDICALVEDGPTREADLRELVVHIHALQHAVMAQAAARAYPTSYRRLGSSLRTNRPE
jgi:hypothetical protein